MLAGETGILLVLAIIFGLIAGLMAYLITYEEYKKHFPYGRRAMYESLKVAAAAILFFTVIPVIFLMLFSFK